MRLCVVNLFGGLALGGGFATLCLILDLDNLRTLIFSSEDAVTAMILLFLGSASTFATAAIAGAVMSLLPKMTAPLAAGAARPENLDLARTARRPYRAKRGRNLARRQSASSTRVTRD
jgi:hypothetical protein